jgi:hypothetical protein
MWLEEEVMGRRFFNDQVVRRKRDERSFGVHVFGKPRAFNTAHHPNSSHQTCCDHIVMPPH